jgi:polyhydroxyalkanoate depolymerase
LFPKDGQPAIRVIVSGVKGSRGPLRLLPGLTLLGPVGAFTAEAEAIQDFYKEYFAVLDLTAEFYLETVDRVFQRDLLGKGELTYRSRPVRPQAIHRTALLTVEGERDDICAVGQTAAAHDLCSNLRPHLKRHHLQPGVGHYGLFSGRKWELQIYPQVRNLVLAMS